MGRVPRVSRDGTRGSCDNVPVPVPVPVPDPSAKVPLPWLLVATWFGSGLSPRAPGTMGSLASLVLWAPMLLLGAPWWAFALASAALFALGTAAANVVVRVRGREDPQLVVIDEVVGMGITLLFAPPVWWSLALAFVLFRIFDIAKPWPVSVADRRVKGGFGVMLDDAVAGLYALACMQLIIRFVLPYWVAP
jgi:phosphatidylglycerophosphatase A